MAGYNELLVGRFNRHMQKLLSMKGPASLTTLSSDLQPVISVQSGVEDRYLEAWNRYGTAQNLATSGGFNSAIRIRNPLGSNVIGVIEKLSVLQFSATATEVDLVHGTVNSDITSLATISQLDARSGPTSNLGGVLKVSDSVSLAVVPNLTSQAPLWGGVFAPNVMYEAIFDENQEITLLPGDALQLSPVAINISFFPSIWWRERFLEDSERT